MILTQQVIEKTNIPSQIAVLIASEYVIRMRIVMVERGQYPQLIAILMPNFVII